MIRPCVAAVVCGADVDQALVSAAADIDWARQQGARIERFNLAQQPLAFADQPVVKAFLRALRRGSTAGDLARRRDCARWPLSDAQ